MQDKKNLILVIGEWLQARQIGRGERRRWLPSAGNVVFTLLVAAVLIGTQGVWAGLLLNTVVPGANATTVNYQGRLADSGGEPVNGNQNMTFALYDAVTGGNLMWGPEMHTGVPVNDGLFNVGLGSQTPGGISTNVWDGDRFLEIKVNTETLMPREPIRSVPIAGLALSVPDGSITSDKLSVEPWSDLPLASGFYSPPNSSWQKAQYRKIGDIVYLRGTITIDSGLIDGGDIVATLPAGYRPPATVTFVSEPHHSLTTKHRLDVSATGSVSIQRRAGDTPHVALDGVFFSVTP